MFGPYHDRFVFAYVIDTLTSLFAVGSRRSQRVICEFGIDRSWQRRASGINKPKGPWEWIHDHICPHLDFQCGELSVLKLTTGNDLSPAGSATGKYALDLSRRKCGWRLTMPKSSPWCFRVDVSCKGDANIWVVAACLLAKSKEPSSVCDILVPRWGASPTY